MAIFPPWPHFAKALQQMGMQQEANLIFEALQSIDYRA
jgi:hypothetical protein